MKAGRTRDRTSGWRRKVPVAEHGANELDFADHVADEGLAAETGVDRHHEDHIHVVDEIFNGLVGGARIEDDAGLVIGDRVTRIAADAGTDRIDAGIAGAQAAIDSDSALGDSDIG